MLRAAAIGDLGFAWQVYIEPMRYVTDRLTSFDETSHEANFTERFLPDQVRIMVSVTRTSAGCRSATQSNPRRKGEAPALVCWPTSSSAVAEQTSL